MKLLHILQSERLSTDQSFFSEHCGRSFCRSQNTQMNHFWGVMCGVLEDSCVLPFKYYFLRFCSIDCQPSWQQWGSDGRQWKCTCHYHTLRADGDGEGLWEAVDCRCLFFLITPHLFPQHLFCAFIWPFFLPLCHFYHSFLSPNLATISLFCSPLLQMNENTFCCVLWPIIIIANHELPKQAFLAINA